MDPFFGSFFSRETSVVAVLACLLACLPPFVLSACAWLGPVPSPARWCLLEGRLRPVWLLVPRALPLSPTSGVAQLCNIGSRK